MKKILVVDELGIYLMLTRLALAQIGPYYQIDTASDGDEALEKVSQERFDLLLLDIKMPRVDGFELLESLRDESIGAPPVIILSGSGLGSDRDRAEALGAIEYVQKAVDYACFKGELRASLKKHGFC